ncbi:MAG: transketolase family protein [Bacillota bacterium]
MIKVAKEHPMDKIEMRQAYVAALIKAAREDERVVAVNCDLSTSMGTVPFAKEFPGRSFNVGIQEANGCGLAAGLSAVGLIPFFHSFATFSSRRICDQLYLSCAYAGLNVKIVGGDPGISATYNGGTHMAFEDIGVLRSIPSITIVEPSDAVMMKQIVPQIKDMYGVVYMRMQRKPTPVIYEEGSEFKIGKAVVLREGDDLSLIASGMTVIETLKAADMLEKDGISARVVDMFTIKPADSECIINCAKETGLIVTVENHNIIGGLGSAVAEVLSEHAPVYLERVGVNDEFGEVGDKEYLIKRFGLDAEAIYERAGQAYEKKKRARSFICTANMP